jgi:hypothetical protein
MLGIKDLSNRYSFVKSSLKQKKNFLKNRLVARAQPK